MNSSAASCGLSCPWAQAVGNVLALPLQVPVVPPWQDELDPGQSLLLRQPLHVPPVHRSWPLLVALQLAVDVHASAPQVPL
jgi:hypothetical protein